VQAAARALGLSEEAVRESLKRLPKQAFAESGTSHQAPPNVPSLSSRELRSGQLLAVLHAYPATELAERVKSEYCRITGTEVLPSVTLPESALFYAEQTFGEDPGAGAADELLHAFEEAVIREAYQEAIRDLRRAEGTSDAVAIESAQNMCTKLAARLAAFGH
jgi:hypothetical protein